MAQKKSVSVKTAAKAPTAAKTKMKAAASKSAATTTATKATKKTTTSSKSTPAKKTATASVTAAAGKASQPKAASKPKSTATKATAQKAAAKPAATRRTTSMAKATPQPQRGAVSKPAKKSVASAAAISRANRSTVKAVAAAVSKPVAKQSTPVVEASAKATAPAKKSSGRHGFKTNEHIVYPAHGVGQIVAIEEQEIAGLSLELFVITFEKDKMTLRVPTGKHESVGMRKLAAPEVLEKAMTTLKGRARVKRTMWSRRAQEYEAKINSGDLISIAEVVRDLYRSESQPEQSYSERQLYELALDRMARELAAIEKLDERGAVQRITDVLSKSAKGRRSAEEAAAEAAAQEEGADVEAA
jgi:CarD family transcriptional regulator